ncbi:hypothetical protein BH09BAC5_BH09BAC5_00450 [soil metagenome]
MKKKLSLLCLLVSPAIFSQTTMYNATLSSGRYGLVQQYVVPNCVNEVEIDAFGAQGGNTNGGNGAEMKGRFSVSFGDTLYIVVGQQGTVNSCGGPSASAGGGGGSFIWKSNGPGRTLLLVAGGGGGGNTNWTGTCTNGIAAVITNNGTQGSGPTSAFGGTGGNGGFGNGPSGTGAGGGGWLTDGQNSTYGTGCTGGLAWPLFDGGSGSTLFGNPGEGDGGFGGGAGAVCGCGGGGGYSGGGGGEGASCRAGGGGGGSYNIGTSQVNTAGVRVGGGQVSVSVTNSSGFTVGYTISPNDTVCSGTMVTVNGTNGSTYSWNNSIVNGVPFLATSSLALQLIGTNSTGCIDTANFMLHVNALPTVSYSANPGLAVCNGNAITLNGTGANNYSWTGGINNGVAFTPASSMNYTVTGTDINGCSANAIASVTVNPLPTVSFTASQDTVCIGSTVILSGTGAVNYSWTGSVTDGVAFMPGSSSSYILTGTDANGCSANDTAFIVVNTLPDVGFTVISQDTICEGTSVTLSGTGATNYSWTGGVTNGISFIPTTTSSYIVTGTDANGCSGSDTALIVVNPNPVVSLGADIVQVNPPVLLDAGAGFNSYLWNTNATTQTISVSNNGIYFVTVTDANGCTDSDSIMVTFTVGINSIENINASMLIFPNPSSGIMILQLENFNAKNAELEISDLNGRLVYSEKLGNIDNSFKKEFDLSSLSSGIYTIRVKADGKQSSASWERK